MPQEPVCRELSCCCLFLLDLLQIIQQKAYITGITPLSWPLPCDA